MNKSTEILALCVGVCLILFASVAGSETELQNVTSGICPPTRVVRYDNGTLGGRVKCMLVDWYEVAPTVNCRIRIPLDNAEHRQKKITLHTEFFDTERHMMVLIINGRRFHGNGFNGDPDAMQVGRTYEYYTRNMTFDLFFMGNRHTFPRSRGFALRYVISDAYMPLTVDLMMSPAALGQPTWMTCSWHDSLEPVSEVRYIQADTKDLLYKFYRNTELNQTYSILQGATVRITLNKLSIYIGVTRPQHLTSYRCLVWDKNYVAYASPTVSLTEAGHTTTEVITDRFTSSGLKTSPRVTTSSSLKTSPRMTTPPGVKTSPRMTTPPGVKTSPRMTTPPDVKTSPRMTTPPDVKTSPRMTTPPDVKTSSRQTGQKTTEEPADLKTMTTANAGQRLSTTAYSPPTNGAVRLSCDSRRMRVIVDLAKFALKFPDVDPKSLTLSDDRCLGTLDVALAHLVWSFPLDACRTRRHEFPSDIVYTNQLTSVPRRHPLIIREADEWNMNLTCMLSRDAIVEDGYGVIERLHAGYTRVFRGNFTLSMDLYRDAMLTWPIRQFPASVGLRDKLYVRVSLNASDPNLKLALHKCVAMPTHDAPVHKQYGLINNKCPQDDTVVIYPATPGGEASGTFSFSTFRFRGGYSSVYISCHVIVCDKSSDEKRCTQRCSRARARRSLLEDKSIHKVYQGPLILDDATNVAASKHSSASQKWSVRNMAGVIMLVAGCVALVTGIVVVNSR